MQDRCGLVHARSDHNIFGRDCESASKCQTICSDSRYKVCTVKCCSSDWCNSGARPTTVPTTTPLPKSRTTHPASSGPPQSPSPSTLSCYTCDSHESWADCDHYARAITCPVAMNTCVKVSIGGWLYRRSCSEARSCRIAKEGCERARRFSEDISCDVRCCSGNLCNASWEIGNSLLITVILVCVSLAMIT